MIALVGVAVAGCQGRHRSEIDGEACVFERWNIARSPPAEGGLSGREEVDLELRGTCNDSAVCVAMVGTADPGVDEFEIEDVGQLSAFGDPGTLAGFGYDGGCPGELDAERAIWRLTGGRLSLEGKGCLSFDLAVGDVETSALRGHVEGEVCRP